MVSLSVIKRRCFFGRPDALEKEEGEENCGKKEDNFRKENLTDDACTYPLIPAHVRRAQTAYPAPIVGDLHLRPLPPVLYGQLLDIVPMHARKQRRQCTLKYMSRFVNPPGGSF